VQARCHRSGVRSPAGSHHAEVCGRRVSCASRQDMTSCSQPLVRSPESDPLNWEITMPASNPGACALLTDGSNPATCLVVAEHRDRFWFAPLRHGQLPPIVVDERKTARNGEET
jgi:hypothetical protein